VTDQPGNGHFDPGDDEDDDRPLDAAEEAAAAAEALAEADETLDERVEQVVADLAEVERRRDGESVTYLAGGRPFAVLLPDVLEVDLDPTVAKAALRTPDVLASSRGDGWLVFTPSAIDRFALDRAEAWVRSAHRRAAGTRGS
jgi:hypothetical protein